MTDLSGLNNDALSIIQRAYDFYRTAQARCFDVPLVKGRSYWLIRHESRSKLRGELVSVAALPSKDPLDGSIDGHSTLFGIPIIWTVDDDRTAPEILLVMEPDFHYQRKGDQS